MRRLPLTVTFIICCLVCTSLRMFLATFDVEAAFLEGKADCQMFVRMPKDVDLAQTRLEIVGTGKDSSKVLTIGLNSSLCLRVYVYKYAVVVI